MHNCIGDGSESSPESPVLGCEFSAGRVALYKDARIPLILSHGRSGDALTKPPRKKPIQAKVTTVKPSKSPLI
jgi:hypothetical protein